MGDEQPGPLSGSTQTASGSALMAVPGLTFRGFPPPHPWSTRPLLPGPRRPTVCSTRGTKLARSMPADRAIHHKREKPSTARAALGFQLRVGISGFAFSLLTFNFLFLDRAFANGGLVGGRFVARLEHHEPCRKDFPTVLVEVDHRVMLVDFDERAGPVRGLGDAIAFGPVFHRCPVQC